MINLLHLQFRTHRLWPLLAIGLLYVGSGILVSSCDFTAPVNSKQKPSYTPPPWDPITGNNSPRLKKNHPLTFFKFYCNECHDNFSGNPPNFLMGEDDIDKQELLDHCLERIHYRLCLWEIKKPSHHAPLVRAMPPEDNIKIIAKDSEHTPQQWIEGPRKFMIRYLEERIFSEKAKKTSCSKIASGKGLSDYKKLPACLVKKKKPDS